MRMTLALKVAESGRNFETSFVENQTTNEAAETDTLNSNEPFDFLFCSFHFSRPQNASTDFQMMV